MLLEGKAALITGASRGIGRAIALAFAKAGASVAVNYAGRAEAAQAVADEINAAGGRAVTMQADIADPAAVDALVRGVVAQLGRLDIMVNNAGITRDALLLRMKDEDFDAVLRTDLAGVFYGTRAAAKIMLKQRSGRIINVASVVGQTGNIGQANYAAAKAGVIGLTKSAARECAPRGVTVNAIAPGFVETDMTATIPEKVRETMLAGIPMGRLGQPEDIAQTALFIASDAAAYITGQVLAVNGGMFM